MDINKEQLAIPLGVGDVKELARTVDVEMLAGYLWDDDERVARNAAWTLTHKGDSEVCALPQDRLIDLAMATPCTPLRRMTLQLLVRQEMTEESLRSDFLDFCLTHMVALEEPSGVQSTCMKLAYRMCSFYPELQHEFQETLSLMHKEHYKPGLTYLMKKLDRAGEKKVSE